MAKDIISKKTRYEFREYMVGDLALHGIEKEFYLADLRMDPRYAPVVSGKRRLLVERFYHSVRWSRWEDVRKILRVFQNVLRKLERDLREEGESGTRINGNVHTDLDEVLKNWKAIRITYLKRAFSSLRECVKQDGFEYKNGRLMPIGKTTQLLRMQTIADSFAAQEIHRQIDRMEEGLISDPALAIGTAKELIETTCKTILQERQAQVPDSWDIGELVRETRRNLCLLPDDIPNATKGVESIRKLLGGLGSIAQGLGELRSLYGTGHGKPGASKSIDRRLAGLAVGSALTLATFLFETHTERGTSPRKSKGL